MAELGLSSQARLDLLKIAEYGAEVWGAEEAREFLASFDDAFSLINRHPAIGRPRQDLGPNVRSWLHRGYILYYESSLNIFEVRRILHGATYPSIEGLSTMLPRA